MEEVARPGPQRELPGTVSGLVERWHDAVSWFGLGRLIASAVAVLLVCVGAFWLVRSPRPPIEASLPQATDTVATVEATLPPPIPIVATSVAADGPVTVHVAGAVRTPGVYELNAGDRVGQAIDAAGGATPDGRPDQLNLAAVVIDGSRVHVPVDGEVVVLPPDVADTAQERPVGPIDVNRASASDLETLPGIGPTTAAAIVAERDRNGPFLSPEDLERVSGVGPAKVELLRELVTM